jgi:hypothetical protein
MLVRGLDVVVDRNCVTVRDANEVVATARWTGRSLENRSGSLAGPLWEELERAIADDEARAVALAEQTAHDQEGVDLTLIDWMLSLTPTERLRVLMRHASGLAAFVRDDLRE